MVLQVKEIVEYPNEREEEYVVLPMNANQKAFVTKLSAYKRQKTNKVSF
jgi:hypothetical protein